MSNAQKASPVVEIEIDRPRKFCLNLRAFNELEKRLGKSLFKAINWNDMGMGDMTLLLWAGLLKDDPALTLDAVEEMVTTEHLMKLMPMISQQVQVSMPTVTEAEAKKEPATTENQPK